MEAINIVINGQRLYPPPLPVCFVKLAAALPTALSCSSLAVCFVMRGTSVVRYPPHSPRTVVYCTKSATKNKGFVLLQRRTERLRKNNARQHVFSVPPRISGWPPLPFSRCVDGGKSTASSLYLARLGHGSAQNAQRNYAGPTVGTAKRPLANREALNEVDALWSAQYISESGRKSGENMKTK